MFFTASVRAARRRRHPLRAGRASRTWAKARWRPSCARAEGGALQVALRLLRAGGPARGQPARGGELRQERLASTRSTSAARPLFAAIDRAMEAGRSSSATASRARPACSGMLGGGDAGPRAPERLPDVPAWGEGERLAFEKESLGFFITGHPLERFRAELAQWATATGAGWPSSAEKEVTVGGHHHRACGSSRPRRATAWRPSSSRTWRAASRRWSSPRPTRRSAGRLAEDQVVLVKGKAEALDEGRARLLVSEVMPLEQAKLAEARFVTIRVPVAALGPVQGRAAAGHTGRPPGRLPGDPGDRRPGAFAVAVAPGAYFRVRPDAVCAPRSRGCWARARWSSPARNGAP